MRLDLEHFLFRPALLRVATSAPSSQAGTLERLPKWLNLIPIVAQWIWLSLRYRSCTLPSCSNPAITSSGMVGEGKLEYLRIMGAQAMRVMATTASAVADGMESIADVEIVMEQAGLTYPIIVKPNLGWCGFGVRRIDDRNELMNYLDAYPRGECIVLQRWIDDPGEAGVFYMRHPEKHTGQVIGMLLRHPPRVTGDGVRSIAQLMAADPRANRLGRDGASEACYDTARIPALGQTVRIAFVAATRVGGTYQDASSLVTPALTLAFDAICHDMKDFHSGRFDVKFENLASLCAGTGFTIIEVNGAGSEAVHAWDPSLTLWQAYRIIFDKQRRLFAIGDAMRRRGHQPVGWWALLRYHLRQQNLISRYPPSN